MRLFVPGALFLFCFTAALPAQVTVRKGSVDLRLDALSGADGSQITALVREHLLRSGVVRIGSGTDGVISGTSSSGTLNGRITDSTGQVIFSKSYSGDWRDNANRFADDIVESLTGQPGIATTRVAFISKRTGFKELYIMDISGQRVVQLTNDRTISGGPSLDRSGSRVAYTSYRSGFPDVYVIDIASGRRTRVAAFPGINSGPAWSPDGRQLALTLSFQGNPEIYIIPAGGGTPQRVTRARGTDSSPSWSPSGRELVYVNDDGGAPRLMRISLPGGSPTPLRTGQSFSTEPVWSPDGKRIAFNALTGGRIHTFVLELESGQTRQLTSGNTDFEDPSWTRNSRHLVVSSAGRLLLLDANTGQSYVINNEVPQSMEPSCSL